MTPLRVRFGTIHPGMPGGIYVTEKPFEDALAAGGEVEVRSIPFGRRFPDESRAGRIARRAADLAGFVLTVLRERPDLVHLNSAFDRRALVRDVGYATLARLLGQRVFFKFHGSDPTVLESGSRFWRWMAAATIRGAIAIGVLSTEERDWFVAHGFPAGKFHVVKNAVDWRRFDGAERRAPSPPRLLFIARMVPTKGLLDVLRALALLRGAGRDVTLLCVGDGPERPAAEALTRELGLGGAVVFTGFVPEAETRRHYLEASALVFPTRREGFSMTIFQSLAAGLPVITTRLRAAADHLREPDHCLWVEPARPDRLAERVAWLLDHPEVAEAMSRNGRALARGFGVETVAAEYLALYRRLCGSA